ncbi:MAG TPA: hypothetical protein PKM73_06195 [Verrucomicrobiota bacterium]|nr:hypothetical protein [Verrucomicrobiota bacterium]HNU51018.1 hypothetical protein [Verrucomicrobiota bacterium]
MGTITIRDLRQRWPEAEARLQKEEELVITRDGRPVARLTRLPDSRPRRLRWDPESHAQQLRRILGPCSLDPIDERLAKDRADRSA